MKKLSSYVPTSKGGGGLVCMLLVLALVIGGAGILPSAAVSDVSISAESAIVLDGRTGEALFEKNADRMLSPASMTKVMTAYTVFAEIAADRLTLDTMIPITVQHSELSRDPSLMDPIPMEPGMSLSVEELLQLMLAGSSNTSSLILAEYISGGEEAFALRMNELARDLGMKAKYQNPHGAYGNQVTARSQAILLYHLIQRFPVVLDYTAMNSVTYRGVDYPNPNQLLAGMSYAYEGADGFSASTPSDLHPGLSATASRNGYRVISVVMDADSYETSHTDSQSVLEYGLQALEESRPFPDVVGHWAKESVAYLDLLGTELHVVDQQFRPDDVITRAEFTAMFYSTLASTRVLPSTSHHPNPNFVDMRGHWAKDLVEEAVKQGWIIGPEMGIFSPDLPITREDLILMIDRAVELPQQGSSLPADLDQFSEEGAEAAARVAGAGLLTMTDGKINPSGTITKGEAAALIHRVLALLQEEGDRAS